MSIYKYSHSVLLCSIMTPCATWPRIQKAIIGYSTAETSIIFNSFTLAKDSGSYGYLRILEVMDIAQNPSNFKNCTCNSNLLNIRHVEYYTGYSVYAASSLQDEHRIGMAMMQQKEL